MAACPDANADRSPPWGECPDAVLGALLVLAFATAGCSSDDDSDATTKGGSSSTAAPAAALLVGTNWVLTGPASIASGDVTPTASFNTTEISGHDGCNGFSAPYSRDGQKLQIDMTAAISTQVACAPAIDAVGTAYRAALADVRLVAISGSTLTLKSLQAKTLLVYRVSSPADIIGKWEATGLYTGNAIQSVAAGTEITATFTMDSVSGSAGCNTYNGPVTLTDTTIAFGPLATTLRLCTEPASTQEQQYLGALGLARTYEVAGNQLTLFRDGGTIAVTYERAP